MGCMLLHTHASYSLRNAGDPSAPEADANLPPCALEVPIDLDGRLCNCRMLHGLPYMDDVILSSLNTWKYTPVLYKGHPQRVYMVIPVRLSAPTAAK